MADRLVAWLHGTPVAVLTPAPEFRVRMEWHADGIERWGLGSPALSVGLPVGSPVGPRDLRGLDFFENMLPEGPALARMAALAGVRPVDTYGILAAFGRDCAGAVTMLPDGEHPGAQGAGGYTPITPEGLRQVISDLDAAPLAAAPSRGFRPSPANRATQEKPALTPEYGEQRGGTGSVRPARPRCWRRLRVRSPLVLLLARPGPGPASPVVDFFRRAVVSRRQPGVVEGTRREPFQFGPHLRPPAQQCGIVQPREVLAVVHAFCPFARRLDCRRRALARSCLVSASDGVAFS